MVYMRYNSNVSNVLHNVVGYNLYNFIAKLLNFSRFFTIFAIMTVSYPQKAYQFPPTLCLRGKLMEIKKPLVMGILNLTSDSFYAESRSLTPQDALKRARAMLDDGADIIDIGACSTRPGSVSVSAEEEMARLDKPLEAIREAFPDAILSLDTFRGDVADECVRRFDIDIVNDISGSLDEKMLETVVKNQVGYVLTHMRGTPEDMMSRCDYGEDVTADVVRELAFSLDRIHRAGVANVIIDPGFGFAKTTAQNLQLLEHLDCLEVLGCPVLAGLSRKTMVRDAGECDINGALVSTIVLNTVSLMKGASIIRVHDVKEGAQTVKTIYNFLRTSD